jgi:hypothetical protein
MRGQCKGKKKSDRSPSSIQALHSCIVLSARRHCHCIPTTHDCQMMAKDTLPCLKGDSAWTMQANKKGLLPESIRTLHSSMAFVARRHCHCVSTGRDCQAKKTRHRLSMQSDSSRTTQVKKVLHYSYHYRPLLGFMAAVHAFQGRGSAWRHDAYERISRVSFATTCEYDRMKTFQILPVFLLLRQANCLSSRLHLSQSATRRREGGGISLGEK